MVTKASNMLSGMYGPFRIRIRFRLVWSCVDDKIKRKYSGEHHLKNISHLNSLCRDVNRPLDRLIV